jgi:hypothetical protein
VLDIYGSLSAGALQVSIFETWDAKRLLQQRPLVVLEFFGWNDNGGGDLVVGF